MEERRRSPRTEEKLIDETETLYRALDEARAQAVAIAEQHGRSAAGGRGARVSSPRTWRPPTRDELARRGQLRRRPRRRRAAASARAAARARARARASSPPAPAPVIIEHEPSEELIAAQEKAAAAELSRLEAESAMATTRVDAAASLAVLAAEVLLLEGESSAVQRDEIAPLRAELEAALSGCAQVVQLQAQLSTADEELEKERAALEASREEFRQVLAETAAEAERCRTRGRRRFREGRATAAWLKEEVEAVESREAEKRAALQATFVAEHSALTAEVHSLDSSFADAVAESSEWREKHETSRYRWWRYRRRTRGDARVGPGGGAALRAGLGEGADGRGELRRRGL